MSQKKIQKVVVYGGITALLGVIVLLNTNFMEIFIERYEKRNLEDRALEGEARFLEYELLYKDMFIYQDYSPWFGYELFNSGGNYGKGYFGSRTLHSDITSIAHSSGIVGVLLYYTMIFSIFGRVYKRSHSRNDKLILLYCAVAFFVYTVTGRYVNVSTNIILLLLLVLPLAKNEEPIAKLTPPLRQFKHSERLVKV